MAFFSVSTFYVQVRKIESFYGVGLAGLKLIFENFRQCSSNLHAIISTLLIINFQSVQKISFAVFEVIYNNVGQLLVAIIQLHALSILQKNVQIRDPFFLYMDPELILIGQTL